MNGSMGRFRIPGMMEDINIEEIISRSKRAPVKPKPKPKPKPKAKAKPKPKPKMPIRPNMRGGRLGLMEDIGLPPVPKKKAVAVKPKPKPKPRPRPTPPRASIARGMEDFARAPVTTSRPKTKPKPKPKPAIVSRPKVTPRPSSVKVPTRPKVSGEDLMRIGQVPDSVRERFKPPAFDRSKLEEIIANARIEKETGGFDSSPFPESMRFDPNAPKPEPLPRSHPFFQSESYKKFITPNADGRGPLLTMDVYTSSDGHKFGSGSVGRMYERWLDENPSYREGTLDPSVSKALPTPLQGETVTEAFRNKEELLKSGGGGLFGGGKSLTPELIQMIKEAQEARKSTDGGAGLFGISGGNQRPQAPEIPQWNMMGPQQPTSPIVGFQDESQPKYPDIPQFMQKAAGETFGGYGGLSSIKPIMQYAGMGDAPIAPRMSRPRPEYDPDAQPGGPPPPNLAKIMRSIFT